MRKALLLVALLLLAPFPNASAEDETIHLWSEQAPGAVLLWDGFGNLTFVNPDQPIDLHLSEGNWTLVRIIDGIPQENPLSFNGDSNATEFLNQTIENPLMISGSAHLDVLGPIEKSVQLNATWSSSITVPNTLGHPNLPNAHLGISHQINNEFGGNQSLFSEWVSLETEIGCCAYDKVDMSGNASVTVFVNNESWGWASEANLTGQGDGRSTRLLWVPITGELADSTDLRITLPSPHEIRYSPQNEFISGLPDDFVIHRGSIGVTGNATIALGTNVAPIVSFHAVDRELPWLPWAPSVEIVSDCTDSSISEPIHRFILRDGNTTLRDELTSTLFIDSMSNLVSPSTWLNLTLECTDPQGLVANHSMDVYIDGVQPTRNLQMQYLHPDDTDPVDMDSGSPTISVPSGAVVSGAVQAGDDSAPPVNIEWTSNKSSGWIHLGIGNHAWNDIFVQGPQINGQHLTIEDRHQAKPLTTYSLQMNLTDAAGNILTQSWNVVVTDRSSPSPRPALSVDGNYYGDLNHPIEGGSPIHVSMNESWDDIDAITALTWSIELNGMSWDPSCSCPGIPDSALTWNDVQSFSFSGLDAGRHTLVVNATDSSGNTGSHSMMFVVEPPLGAMYRITDVVKIGDGGPGEPGALEITMENDGRGESYFRLCYLNDCTSQFRAIEASVDGPGQMTHQISVTEWASGEVVVVIEYPDNSTEEYESGLTVVSEMTPLMWVLLFLPPLIGLVALWFLKRQPDDENS
ncbi:MAG: hypothetical protein VX473_05030 [Candidatus Thermoplasmatota archaeon]|nr:hypothetical protein [Candidatus Thermoplasmatota archaeon]